MALEQFRPKVWSRQLIVDTDKALVLGNIASTQYEGEIMGAGTVLKINEIGDITVSDYTEDEDITVQTLTDAQKELVIDRKKYFAFQVDDVAAAQAGVDVMQGAMQKASFSLRDEADSFLGGLYTEAGVRDTTTLGTDLTSHQNVYATSGGNDGILGVIANMEIALNNNNVPGSGRWIAWPSWAAGYLKYAGIVDDIGGSAKPQVLPNGGYGPGYLGNLLGFDHYVSNNVSNNGTAYAVMFGTYGSIAFAAQVLKTEAVRREKRFADMVKGLYVYGGKVVRPDNLGVAFLDPAGLSS
jgi:hypothetical protein